MIRWIHYLVNVLLDVVLLFGFVGFVIVFCFFLRLSTLEVADLNSLRELKTFDDTPPPIKEELKRSEAEVWLLKNYGGSTDCELYVVVDPPSYLRRVILKGRSDSGVQWEHESGWSVERDCDGILRLSRLQYSYREVRRHPMQLNGIIGYNSSWVADLAIHNGSWEESSHVSTLADYGFWERPSNPIHIPTVSSHERGEAKRLSP